MFENRVLRRVFGP